MTEEKKVYTLLQLNRSIKNALETKSGHRGFWVKAEIAKVTHTSKGFAYIDFVEESNGVRKAAIKGNIWSSALEKIKAQLGSDFNSVLKAGSEIVFLCRVTFHEVYGLSLSISEIDLSFMLGELERRKKEAIEHIKKEGIDELNKALTLPRVIHKIALVGSPGTSGFRDFCHHVCYNKYQFKFDIEVFRSPVQGAEAPPKIIEALRSADSSGADTIVLVRGGGSPLDLDCFNNLDLAIAIGNLKTPVLTGIGHETDFSVADLVAHEHLKTPTDVGEFVVNRSLKFASLLIEIASKVGSRAITALSRENKFLSNASLLIREMSLKVLSDKKAELGQINIDIKREFERCLSKNSDTLNTIANTIKLLHPSNTLQRGYSIVKSEGKSIRSVDQVSVGDSVEVELTDGFLKATINEINKK